MAGDAVVVVAAFVAAVVVAVVAVVAVVTELRRVLGISTNVEISAKMNRKSDEGRVYLF